MRSNVNDKENNARANIGFLTDANRLNVALTRAKYALYIVGNFRVLQVSMFFVTYNMYYIMFYVIINMNVCK